MLRISTFLALAALLLLNGFVDAAVPSASVKGRYVHISIPGRGKTLSLAEVEVFSGGKNVALKKKALQNSTAHNGAASRGVDGTTDGDWAKNSITHTSEGVQAPAWEVDLGGQFAIDKISLWNRDGFESRLDGVQVLILTNKRKGVWGASIAKAGKGENALLIKDHQDFKKTKRVIPEITAAQDIPAVSNKSQQKKTLHAVLAEDNGGIHNGPLYHPQLKSSSLGDKTTLRLAIEDLTKTFGPRYPKGRDFLKRLDGIGSHENNAAFDALKKEALLANPLIDFDQLLLIKRIKQTGLVQNWQGNSSMGDKNCENELMTLSLKDGRQETIYKPQTPRYVGDFDLHFDAGKILFSSLTDQNNWGVYEVQIDGSGFREVSPDMGKDVDNYDPIYLPNGKILFNSSSSYAGVPCVGGSDFVANLHIMNNDGTGVRRLCFEQDNNWYPVMMGNGRVMFTRWEYTDSAHYFSRVLMHMNPDGTDQRAFYGSNSYWPNSLFYARPIPGSSSKFIGIVSGHHGVAREGAMVLFDTNVGNHEADGAVQVMTARGKKVEPLVLDRLASAYAPHFLHPYPLSEKYFFGAIKQNRWNICLVDVFDNVLVLTSEKDTHFFEPVPLRKTVTPPVIPDRVNLADKESTVLLTDIYSGPGLAGVPRGSVKSLRIYRYEYSPRKKGGHYAMGMESGWDARNILGTVPVESDGSAMFKIPANAPVSLQPLDAEGKALQLMRSWLVGMPGETLSCVGCHESSKTAPASAITIASRQVPNDIRPWYGPARGFSYQREIQPVVDKYCVGCHDGQPAKGRYAVNDRRIGTGPLTGEPFKDKGIPDFSLPQLSHRAIHPYVRRNGPEGDYHLLTPLEFHADTSELVQMLEKGHHNVKLDKEAWDRLITWIDLMAPYNGTWTEVGADKAILKRRLELQRRYANIDYNPEIIHNPYEKSDEIIMPQKLTTPPANVSLEGWPFDADAAREKQGTTRSTEIRLSDEITMKFVRIPQGKFVMGSLDETPVEQPLTPVKIASDFWMGTTEVTLEQYRQFDPSYLNGVYDMHYKDQVKRGYYMNHLKFPVIRVPWTRAMAFCAWLSEKTGKQVTLPSEAQWEWACRAGTGTPLSYGGLDSDFGEFGNLADITVKEMAVSGVNPTPIKNPNTNMDFELKDPRFNDGVLHLDVAGSYKPNAWGLYDMHGNVAEWTRSDYKPYPYNDNDGRNGNTDNKKVVRGGSWHDRPFRATSSYRLGYPTWQKVYHTGFRVIIEP
ncbi:MAG: SUMF1/EgtB/PvdO family nonheme iron enzyme [Phycisphaerae bacterium]|nr:SUMF1/EgtB/PvdO family nonheme iron enzyme [Phycisphaerae bacterium]